VPKNQNFQAEYMRNS